MIADLVEKSPIWLDGDGPLPEIVISSRARLARNLKGFPFDLKAKDRDREKVEKLFLEAIGITEPLKSLTYIPIDTLSDLDKAFLVERHLITFDLLKRPIHRGVAINKDETISIMVNEEDHLRIQSIKSGYNLDDALEEVMSIEEKLGEYLEFSFHNRFGFLTACPTNVGLGLRLSVLLHLPGVIYHKRLEEFFSQLRKRNVSVRGFYGEGSEVHGNIFQISSRITLGVTERDVLNDFKETIDFAIDFEKNTRSRLIEDNREVVEDRIYRSLATLQSARLLTFRETAEHVSAVRLGVGLGLFLDIKTKTLNELLLFSQPAHLQKLLGKEMTPEERDVRRASYVRAKLKAD